MNKYLIAAMFSLMTVVASAETQEFRLVIKDHVFQPAEVRVPANTKVILVIENQDSTPEEFESHDMHREKMIAGNKTVSIKVGPLKPGRYAFFGEFNEDTAKGVVIAE